jgi:hypothetical protein
VPVDDIEVDVDVDVELDVAPPIPDVVVAVLDVTDEPAPPALEAEASDEEHAAPKAHATRPEPANKHHKNASRISATIRRSWSREQCGTTC